MMSRSPGLLTHIKMCGGLFFFFPIFGHIPDCTVKVLLVFAAPDVTWLMSLFLIWRLIVFLSFELIHLSFVRQAKEGLLSDNSCRQRESGSFPLPR